LIESLIPDLVLLKLFADGTQDLWDIRQLLATPGGNTIIQDVEEALQTMPQSMREAWNEARR
jgi:predicted naringenin-chalcone synthase